MNKSSIGLIGLGRLGSALADNLLASGFPLTVYNRTKEKIAPFIAKGARADCDSVHEAASSSRIVITIVANDAAVEELTGGDNGIAANLPPGGIHLSMSTIGPDTAKAMDSIHRNHGNVYLSGLILGRPDAARAKTLTVCLSGNGGAKREAYPVIEALGVQHIVDFGEDVTAANVAKLCCNFLIAAAMEAMGEALALAKKNGVDPAAIIDLITRTLFAGAVYKNYGTMIAEQRFTPAGFLLPLGLKDINLVIKAANESNVPMPLGHLVRERLQHAMEEGRSEMDWAALVMGVWEEAGLVNGSKE